VLERKVVRRAPRRRPDELLLQVRTAADRELAPYRRKMPAAQIEQLHSSSSTNGSWKNTACRASASSTCKKKKPARETSFGLWRGLPCEASSPRNQLLLGKLAKLLCARAPPSFHPATLGWRVVRCHTPIVKATHVPTRGQSESCISPRGND